MIISISGNPGSGKSTVAKILIDKLGAERIYVGGIRRELARKKGMTLEELNEYAKTHPETDVDVDRAASEKARELERGGKVVIAEGRTMFHFIPESIKVYVKVDANEGARRIWQDLQKKELADARNEGAIGSIEEMKEKVARRHKEDSARYVQYYQIDPSDESHYDFVVDSTKIPAVEVAEKILAFVRKNSNS